jgi:alcohol dehydrogenase
VLRAPYEIALETFAVPEVGPDDALLEIELAGVCGTDHHAFIGKLAVPMPIILGHEILGRIVAIGHRAAARYGVSLGQSVTVEASVPCWACEDCLGGGYRFCRTNRGYGMRLSTNEPPALWGAIAELMHVAPGSIVHPVPAGMPPRVAVVASIFANGIQWLRYHGELSTGDTVVIQGAGPQGLAATMIARESGAAQIIVTGLARDASRLALARSFGADTTIVADEEDVVATVSRLTAGRLADLVLDVTGSSGAVQTSVALVRRRGRLVLGGLSGHGTETALKLDELVWKEIRLQGVFAKGANAISAANRILAARGHLYPLQRLISHVYTLDNAGDAIVAAGGSEVDGFIKAAIAPSGERMPNRIGGDRGDAFVSQTS